MQMLAELKILICCRWCSEVMELVALDK
uniref:Uncharacterized protein n=1 Tax=Anguilla anguilla TaxID=7936 RepID=A0A0E9V1I3_ANGAN